MGTKRTDFTGREDTLGRPVKESHKTVMPAISGTRIPEARSDFTPTKQTSSEETEFDNAVEGLKDNGREILEDQGIHRCNYPDNSESVEYISKGISDAITAAHRFIDNHGNEEFIQTDINDINGELSDNVMDAWEESGDQNLGVRACDLFYDSDDAITHIAHNTVHGDHSRIITSMVKKIEEKSGEDSSHILDVSVDDGGENLISVLTQIHDGENLISPSHRDEMPGMNAYRRSCRHAQIIASEKVLKEVSTMSGDDFTLDELDIDYIKDLFHRETDRQLHTELSHTDTSDLYRMYVDGVAMRGGYESNSDIGNAINYSTQVIRSKVATNALAILQEAVKNAK